MNLLRSFRFSTYLTLAISVLCLGYAEGTLLAESPYITVAVVVLIAFAYQFEGRWSLSLPAANFVGALLILTLVGWIAYQFVRKPTELVHLLPFPAFLLPFLGPVLMILIPAKLFRPKHNGDYWALHGIGILSVSLGCAMANDMFFGVLLIVYLFCFAWSISLFHLIREVRFQIPQAASTDQRGRTYLFRFAWRWSLVISSAGLLMFLITPRPNDNKWELPMVMRGKIETGLRDVNDVDLNRTATLEQNSELAFVVEARNAQGTPKNDLDPNQRWRASSLVVYEGGKWTRGREKERSPFGLVPPPLGKINSLKRSEAARLPDFGPNSYTLSFWLGQPTASMAIAASPVLWREGDDAPFIVYGPRLSPVVQRPDRSFEWISSPSPNRPSYLQVTAPASEPDLAPAMQISSGYIQFLTRLPHPNLADRLRGHTSDLLKKLVERGQLTPDALEDVDPFSQLPSVRQHEAIARAIERHLSSSGEYRYTLQLERSDRTLDPVEDFIYNTKAGHCQRFASALALMLRSQGIPAQFVLGFRGCESVGEGKYEVRQYHAHAWVEVIVSRSPPTKLLPMGAGELLAGRPDSQHWLTLDPTPTGSPEQDEKNGIGDWLDGAISRGETFFKTFILGYDSAARRKTVESITTGFEEFCDDVIEGEITWPVVSVGVCLLIAPTYILVCRRLRRRRFAKSELASQQETDRILPYYFGLIELLAKHGLTPKIGETARSFAMKAATTLTASKASAVADIPVQMVEAYYQARFGGHVLDEATAQELGDGLTRLADGLKTTQFQAAPAITDGKT